MPAFATCPETSELLALDSASAAPDRVESLAAHLEVCDACAGKVAVTPAADTLLKDLRKAETAQGTPAEENVVQRLIQRLAQLGPRRPETLSGSAASEGTVGPQGNFSFLAPAQSGEEIGRLGPYRVLKSLGSGGMGVVFLAEDEQLRRRVALKAMHTAFNGDPAARERFLREARTMAAIEHDNIVTVYQVGEDRGVPYLAMQLLVGESLDDRLKREHRLPLPEALRIAREIATGLAAAQARGLIHRDIKPGNIWLEGDRGRVKILDFGLARGLGSDVELTQSGAIIGTPAYMAPEQASGLHVDARADLFSVGVVLYRMLTGESPFQRSNITSTLLAVTTHDQPPVHTINPEIPVPLSNLVESLLQKDPEQRPASAASVLQELSALESPPTESAHVEPKTAERPRINVAAPRPQPKSSGTKIPRNWLIALALGGLAALCAGGVWIIIKGPDGKILAKVKADGPVKIDVVPEENLVEPAPAVPKPNVPAPLPTPPDAQPPLSRLALVGSPARLPGVESWTLETTAHRGEVRSLAISPDSRWLATAGDDASIRVWKLADGSLHAIFVGHSDMVRQLAWSRDSKEIISIDRRGCWLWNVADGRRSLVQQRDAGELVAVGWGEKARQVILANGKGEFETWDIDTVNQVASFAVVETAGFETSAFHAGPPAFSPDGKRIAIANRESVVVVDNAGKKQNETDAESYQVFFSWAADSARLAVGMQHGHVLVWQTEGKDPPRQFSHKVPGVDAWLTGVAWSPDQSEVVAGGFSLKGWNVTSGKEVEPLRGQLWSHGYAFSPDGNSIATYSNGSIEVCDRGRRALRWTQTDTQVRYAHVVWSPTGEQLAFLTTDRQKDHVAISTARDGTILRRYELTAFDLRWLPEGNQLLATREGGSLLFFDIANSQPVRTLATGHEGAFYVRAAKAANRIATWDLKGNVKLWTVGKTEPDHVVTGYTGPVRLEWSPDGSRLAVGGLSDAKVAIIDPKSGQTKATCVCPDADIHSIGWSPDSGALVTAGTHCVTLYCFDAASGKVIQKINAAPGGRSFLWANDKRLAFFTYDHEVRWWNWDLSRFEAPRPSYDFDHNASYLAPDLRGLTSLELPGSILCQDYQSTKRHGVMLGLGEMEAIIGAQGDFRLSHPRGQAELRVAGQIGGAQRLFTVAEFAAEFGWKNDPNRAILYPPAGEVLP